MSKKPYTVLAIFEAKPGKEKALETVLLSLIEPSRAEATCINYDLHKCHDNPAAFMFYENWQSKEALEVHLQMPHLKEAQATMEGLLVKPAEVTFWAGLDAPVKY